MWERGEHYPVWMSHGDRITKMPPGFEVAGVSANAPFAVIQDEKRKYYGLMFHPEVVHTPNGAKLLRNFVRKISGANGDWTMRAFKDEAIEKIRAQVGKGRVICGLSGGVDSAVAAVLIHEAIGEQLTCVFVDHGLLRLDEGAEGRRAVPRPLQHSAGACRGREAVPRRARRRRAIRKRSARPSARLFIDVFEAEAKKIGGAEFLAQGTLYPDVIESVSFTGGPSVTIKSHHNVGGLPERMNMKLVEPLARTVQGRGAQARPRARPAGGLRRPASVSRGRALRSAARARSRARSSTSCASPTTSIIEEIRHAGLYDDIWQAFAVILPVKTVGVMGDGRTYDFVVGLRAVTSTDGMTADFYPFDMKFLGRAATRIINEVKGVNRVVYDVTSKPPGTIEWE